MYLAIVKPGPSYSEVNTQTVCIVFCPATLWPDPRLYIYRLDLPCDTMLLLYIIPRYFSSYLHRICPSQQLRFHKNFCVPPLPHQISLDEGLQCINKPCGVQMDGCWVRVMEEKGQKTLGRIVKKINSPLCRLLCLHKHSAFFVETQGNDPVAFH